jgi:hypothetical protein
MSNPTYLTGTVIFIASGLRNRVQISTEAGRRDCRLLTSQLNVSPESMMSSTISTCRLVMSVSRSLRIRTTPDDLVPDPYDEIAIQSISMCRRKVRARSAITITAPLRTPITSRSSVPS